MRGTCWSQGNQENCVQDENQAGRTNGTYAASVGSVAPAIQQAQGPHPDLVSVVKANGYESGWGFVLFRTDFRDQDRWEKNKVVLDMHLEFSIKPYQTGMHDIASIADGFDLTLIEDPSLAGASDAEIRRYACLPSTFTLYSLIDAKFCGHANLFTNVSWSQGIQSSRIPRWSASWYESRRMLGDWHSRTGIYGPHA